MIVKVHELQVAGDLMPLLREELAKVYAGGEVLPCAGDYYNPDRVVGLGLPKGRVKLNGQLRVERVHRLRPV